MILQTITLYNFRQYYGEHNIQFSTSSSKNVTVIHGENGSGKTALLNAFNWCLYGVNDLPHPDKIINDHATNVINIGERASASVEIEFSQDDVTYIIKRVIEVEKVTNDKVTHLEPEVRMQTIDASGICKEQDNVQNRINQLMPEDLRTYFFFDGERIDNLAKDEGAKDIQSAIKLMMGLEILERGMQHTEAVRKKFRSDLKQSGNLETKTIIEEIEKLEIQEEQLHGELSIYNHNVTSLMKEKSNVESRLKSIEKSKKLQNEREEKQQEKRSAKEKLIETKSNLSYLLSKQGYLGYTNNLIKDATKFIKEDGQDQSKVGIKESTINQLLNNQICICGQDLTDESSSHVKHLLNLKQAISGQELHNFGMDMIGSLSVLDEKRKQLYIEMKRLKEQEIKLEEEIKRIDEQLDEISSKLSDKSSEEIASLENKLQRIDKSHAENYKKIGETEHLIKEVNKALQIKNEENSKIESKREEGKLTQLRIDTCLRIEEAISNIYKVQEVAVKERLQDRISKVYSEFLRKGYKVSLSSNYELKVMNEMGTEVSLSQGERQITSLSFIGAVVDIAREEYKSIEKQEFNEGGIYPIVMDSPFGSLDSDHRNRVAQGIPNLADQVIVIVSTSQWRGEVSEQMADVIGKEYKLLYNDPRHNKDNPYEFTNIIKVD